MKVIVKVISSIANWWNLKTNQRHWYEIKFVYSERGINKIEWVDQIGVLCQFTILDKVEVKKSFPPLHKRNFVNKVELHNGNLDVIILCYLGKFSQKTT